MESSRALTATVHNPQPHFVAWCEYHLRHFDIIMVWADEPEDLAALQQLADDRVEVRLGAQIPHTSKLTRTLLRQDANANAALSQCRQRQIDWLLHIDDDELFHPSEGMCWRQDAEVSQLHFVNHEACPRWSVDNPFSEIQHFKLSGQIPFLLYEGGKSAVRCKEATRADGPHRFAVSRGKAIVSRDADVLHYGCYSYRTWLHKYFNLGSFSDWYRDDLRTPITKRFHLDSRNVVQQCLADGSFEPSEAFFRQFVWNKQALSRGLREGKLLYF